MPIAPVIETRDLGCGSEIAKVIGWNDLTTHSLVENTADPTAIPISACGLDICFFSEKDDSGRDAWADGFRGAIMERLAGEGCGWWLNMRGSVAEPYYQATVWRDLTEVLAEEAGQRYAGKLRPWQYWQSVISGNSRYDFVYIGSEAVRSTVQRHWGHAHPGWNLEGCCVREAERMRAFDWLQGEALTVSELLDRCEFLMVSFASEYRHMSVLTTKYNANEIRERIQVKDMEREIAMLT
jgi:hypothetical protein